MESIKKNSIKKNYLFNLIYQIFLLVVPLVVTPYIARTLTVTGVGIYSFSFSLISYFTILANFGFTFYGQREIAKYSNDRVNRSKIFWEMVVCRVIFVIISSLTNILFCIFNIYGHYSLYMLILTINILSVGVDVTFFFQGIEEFGKIVVRNVLIKTISIILIFCFVRDSNALWIYTLINAVMVLVCNLSLWTYLKKYLVKVKIREVKPFRHIKGSLLLFIPTIATSIYLILDKTLIGILVPGTYVEIVQGLEVIKKYADLENGYYDQAEKLIKMAMTVITSIGTVMIPRNSIEFENGNDSKLKENIYSASSIVWMIGLPMTFGFLAIVSDLVPWYLGPGYDKVSILIPLLSPIIIIIGFSNVFGLQYLVPSRQDKKFSIALLVGAIVNLLLNIILIPSLYSIGAALATIIAELCVTLVMAFFIKKQIELKKCFHSFWKYLLASIIMFIIVYCISYFLPSKVYYSMLEVMVGIVVYFAVLLLFKEDYVLKYFNRIISKIRRNKQ